MNTISVNPRRGIARSMVFSLVAIGLGLPATSFGQSNVQGYSSQNGDCSHFINPEERQACEGAMSGENDLSPSAANWDSSWGTGMGTFGTEGQTITSEELTLDDSFSATTSPLSEQGSLSGATEAETSPMSGSTIGTAPTSPNFKIHGFVNPEWRWVKDNAVQSGFILNDAAFYLSHNEGDFEFFVDLPFQYERQYNGADADGDNESNDFQIGGRKAQAYVAYSLQNFRLQLGQYDTPYGFELNDTADNFFSAQGIVYSRFIPITHAGLMASYKGGPFGAKLFVANPTNQGSRDAAPATGLASSEEYGAQVGYGNDFLNVTVGYLERNDERDLLDVIAGASFGMFAVNAEYSMLENLGADSANGWLIMPVVNFSDKWAAAARYEQVSKAVGAYDENQIALGVDYKYSGTVRLRGEYIWNDNEPTQGATRIKSDVASIGAVYRF